MNYNKLKENWIYEQEYAFKGWDFSHLDDRWEHESLPWDYDIIVKSKLKETDSLLDMGTGGGEYLLSLGHPFELTTVTEAYPPNVELCKNVLSPLGITVTQTYDDDKLPIKDNSIDIIINRHESFDLHEVDRVLKSGGYFITQQVGCTNNNDLSCKLITNFSKKDTSHKLENYLDMLSRMKYSVEMVNECFPKLKFFDVGAVVFFAKIIEWEFPDFSVETSFNQLCELQLELEKNGFIDSAEHRFAFVARKP